jgi:hypothetical protein
MITVYPAVDSFNFPKIAGKKDNRPDNKSQAAKSD